jgi:hypothetical protein
MWQTKLRPKCVVFTNNQVEIVSNLTGQGCHIKLGQKHYPIVLDKFKLIKKPWIVVMQ